MTEHTTHQITVWDPLVRLFHWTLVVAFVLAYLSQGELFEELQDRLDGERSTSTGCAASSAAT
jgi:hypothetical protein